MTRRALRSLLAAGIAASAIPASADAAVRHAAVNGSGTACTAAAPCLFQQALAGAAGADEVVVHAGTHQALGAASINKVSIAGAPGEAMPTIETQAGSGGCGISARATRSAVRRLRIRVIAVGTSGLCVGASALVEQVVITSTHADVTGLSMRNGDWTRVDALSVNLPTTGGRGIEVRDSRDVQLDNVSLRAADAALWVDGDVSASIVSVRNSFLDSPEEAVQISCHDVTAYSIVQASTSAVGTVDEGPCAFTEGGGNIPIAGTDVTADALGVLRLGPDSTLRDAGRRDSGETADRDVDGDPRSLGVRMDIGADELRIAPLPAAAAATRLAPTGVTLIGIGFGNGAEQLTATFELGPTAAYGRAVAGAITAPSGRFGFPTAEARVDGLAPATAYHARLVLRNEWGMEAVGPDQLFTTPAAPVDPGQNPAPAPGPGPAPGGGAGGGSGGGGGSAAADRSAPRCSEPARLTLKIARKGRTAKQVVLRVPGGQRFAKSVALGRLATTGRRIAITPRDAAGNMARPLGLKVRRR